MTATANASLTRRTLLAAAAASLAACAPVTPRAHWPALVVHDLAGRTLALPADTGRIRVVNLWALWCAPCRRELPGLQRLARAYAGRAVDVSAIALAPDLFAVREYVAQEGLALPMAVLAPDTPPARALELRALPETFMLSRSGAVLARWTGAREWDAASVRAELDRVLEAG